MPGAGRWGLSITYGGSRHPSYSPWPTPGDFLWTRRFIYCRPAGRSVSESRAYPRAYAPPPMARPGRAAPVESRRSNAAIPVVVVLVLLGLYLGQYTFLVPGALGVVLLKSGGSFLSTRINPLSPHFYLLRKPSWPAVGVVFLGAALLLGYAYYLFVHEFAAFLPK